MTNSRRSLLFGLGTSLIVAPAIVRYVSIMPVKALDWEEEDYIIRCYPQLSLQHLEELAVAKSEVNQLFQGLFVIRRTVI
jgi:hypothetical protein